MIFFSWIRSLFTSKVETVYTACESCGRVLTPNFYSLDSYGVVCDVCLREGEMAMQPKDEFPKLGKHEPEEVEPREDFSKFDEVVVVPIAGAKIIPVHEPIKECSHCHIGYPATTEYFFKRKGTKDGLQYYCKSCKRLASKISRAKKAKARSHKGN